MNNMNNILENLEGKKIIYYMIIFSVLYYTLTEIDINLRMILPKRMQEPSPGPMLNPASSSERRACETTAANVPSNTPS